MIKLTGTLLIRRINGRNGSFSVGRLVTEIGEFAVKDPLLEQYDEGRYEGEFGVSRIFPSHYLASDRLVVQIRATLETLALANIAALPAAEQEAPVEPDPLDLEPPAPVTGTPSAPPALEPESPTGDPFQASDVSDPLDEDAELFGALWPLGDTVRLDTTVDRGRFRRQHQRLNQLGYRFQAVGQLWMKSAA